MHVLVPKFGSSSREPVTTSEPKSNPALGASNPASGARPNAVPNTPPPGGVNAVPKTPPPPPPGGVNAAPNPPPASGQACVIKRSLDGSLYKRCPTDGGSSPTTGQKRKNSDASSTSPPPMGPADDPNIIMKGPVASTDTRNNPDHLNAATAHSGGTAGVHPTEPNTYVANKDADIKKSGVDAALTQGATEGAGVDKIRTDAEGTPAEKAAALKKLKAQPNAGQAQAAVNAERADAGKQPVIPNQKMANMEDPPRQMGDNSNLPTSVFSGGPNLNSGRSGALEQHAMSKLGKTVDGNQITQVAVGAQNVGGSRAETETAARAKQNMQDGSTTPARIGGKYGSDDETFSDREGSPDGPNAPKKPKPAKRDLLEWQIEAREVLDRVLKREAFKRSIAQKLARRDFLESLVPMVEVY